MLLKQIIDNHLNGFLSDNKEFSTLSQELQDKLKKWDENKKPIERLGWTNYFLAMAYLARLRSPDARTRCGAVIVDQNNTIISTGYNGMLSGIDERILPNYNEEKYPFFIHSELNAILNAAKQGKSTINCTVYLTGQPCFACLQHMWQAGIAKVVTGKNHIVMLDNKEYLEKVELFKYLTGNRMPIIETEFDETKLKELLK